jgi:hypothetical protein
LRACVGGVPAPRPRWAPFEALPPGRLYRVSTARQGRSGLGLEAQRNAIQRFYEAEGFDIVAERVEVETGKGADALDRRPELAAALAEAKRRKAPVIVAKLDRLSRDVAFIAGLMAPLPASPPPIAEPPTSAPSSTSCEPRAGRWRRSRPS